jgi:hypothetical protein
MGYTKREMYVQFLTRIYCEIPQVVLANFSTLKNLQAPMFSDFRSVFSSEARKIIFDTSGHIRQRERAISNWFFHLEYRQERSF